MASPNATQLVSLKAISQMAPEKWKRKRGISRNIRGDRRGEGYGVRGKQRNRNQGKGRAHPQDQDERRRARRWYVEIGEEDERKFRGHAIAAAAAEAPRTPLPSQPPISVAGVDLAAVRLLFDMIVDEFMTAAQIVRIL